MRRHDNHKYTEAISYQRDGAARVDPHDLAKYFRTDEIRSKAEDLSGLPATILFGKLVPGKVQIKGNTLLVECVLQSGMPLIVRVPLDYYEGIGARFVVGKREGNPVICILELVHKDPGLTVPVMVTTDLEEAAVDWKSWSRRFGLTMLHQPLGQAGNREAYQVTTVEGENLSGLFVAEQQPRRHHAQFAARRPRFLSRRKVGVPGQLANLKGREIIARN